MLCILCALCKWKLLLSTLCAGAHLSQMLHLHISNILDLRNFIFVLVPISFELIDKYKVQF